MTKFQKAFLILSIVFLGDVSHYILKAGESIPWLYWGILLWAAFQDTE